VWVGARSGAMHGPHLLTIEAHNQHEDLHHRWVHAIVDEAWTHHHQHHQQQQHKADLLPHHISRRWEGDTSVGRAGWCEVVPQPLSLLPAPGCLQRGP
jgi:hypothetical protein